MSGASFFGDMLQTITERGRQLLALAPFGGDAPRPSLEQLCERLLGGNGEASGMALASLILERWRSLDGPEQAAFMTMLLERFGADESRLDAAIDAHRAKPSADTVRALHAAAEPRRQEIIRRLNLAPEGVGQLVRMREALLRMLPERPELAAVDADFAHLFGSWFNRGFLVLKPVDWATPANVLEKIIRYEAVHEIKDWDELRRRVQPVDRRCFAFFHPRLPDEPLIFVEVALTTSIAATISDVLDEDRAQIRAEDATTAVFYSISNCQEGLRGVSFGNFLIKQVVADLRRDLPKLSTFVTLSPMPGFAAWLARQRAAERPDLLDPAERAQLAPLDDPAWDRNPDAVEELQPALCRAAATYLLRARNPAGLAADPVARFHLGNGARLERINFLGDRSPRGLRQAHGMMVNYLYDLSDIEKNHEAFIGRGEVIASPAVQRLAPTTRASQPRSVRPEHAA
ncbi:malonyl-CoA decarboxylase [Hansschlegelia beijingensis]|uniref:Malonyl-CoA decarboxylase n=1 Tax=Hansschlegelia beijingensis TaxID=1133344 RepID=A0A7W6GGP1_9HYPH|nr:malonyl-CoA decarboxylase [Hansschlegelia beijingensis]MBB3974282.1 malonyl-CoA decarboxylase [Hansschlegelia beijingensis]